VLIASPSAVSMISIAAANLSPSAQLIHEVRIDSLAAFKEMLSKDSGERQ
jgi:hypothetical protein